MGISFLGFLLEFSDRGHERILASVILDCNFFGKPLHFSHSNSLENLFSVRSHYDPVAQLDRAQACGA